MSIDKQKLLDTIQFHRKQIAASQAVIQQANGGIETCMFFLKTLDDAEKADAAKRAEAARQEMTAAATTDECDVAVSVRPVSPIDDEDDRVLPPLPSLADDEE